MVISCDVDGDRFSISQMSFGPLGPADLSGV